MNYPRQKQEEPPGPPSTTSDFKKAIVTLKAGDKIELV
jgi:ribosomal protein L23